MVGNIGIGIANAIGFKHIISKGGGGGGSISYPGLIAAWSVKGKSNDDEDRAILKDLTGNGHDITLNGFAFNTEGSGYGHLEYPDALVFDGVDDYGINENMPIQDDFTLIIKRHYINTKRGSCLISKAKYSGRGAFIMEVADNNLNDYCNVYSFNGYNDVPLYYDDISYLTSNKYNNIPIKKGPNVDLPEIILGKVRTKDATGRIFNGAFYSAYLFDRSLDEQEIKSFIRKYIDPEYLLPSEIPTPDCYYDFSQGSNDDENRDTIKDYSGNGNDAVAYNFAWNEEGSGYKDGALVFDGVDDYVSLDAFDSGFKTVFALFKLLKTEVKVIYDQRKGNINAFSIQTVENQIAYNFRNDGGCTYINGKLNNVLTPTDLVGKKLLSIISNNNANADNTITPIIGKHCTLDKYHVKFPLYKFLGFKEALTEEQINAIIKKYNLLDGVDEIEVS